MWFDIAKAHTEQWGRWKAYSIFADTAGGALPEVPRLKGDMADLVVAERFLDRDHDLRAAAVYVRAHSRRGCVDYVSAPASGSLTLRIPME
jgi:hypothetical protein